MSNSGQHRRPKSSTLKRVAALGFLAASGVALSASGASAAEQPAAPQGGLLSGLTSLAPVGTETPTPTPAPTPVPMPTPAPQAPAPQAPSAPTLNQSSQGEAPLFNVPIDLNLELVKDIHDVFVDVPFLMGETGAKTGNGGSFQMADSGGGDSDDTPAPKPEGGDTDTGEAPPEDGKEGLPSLSGLTSSLPGDLLP